MGYFVVFIPSAISPEAYLDLKIHLDKLSAIQSRCGEALTAQIAGDMTRDTYLGLLDHQADAQRARERRHRKHFAPDREA